MREKNIWDQKKSALMYPKSRIVRRAYFSASLCVLVGFSIMGSMGFGAQRYDAVATAGNSDSYGFHLIFSMPPLEPETAIDTQEPRESGGFSEIKQQTDQKTSVKSEYVDAPVDTPQNDIEPDGRAVRKLMVALTFDDGPRRNTTSQLLDVLDEKKAPATFFILGERGEMYPEIIRRMIEEGHTLGNHTQSHKNLNKLSQEDIIREIEGVNEIIERAGGDPVYIRPPYGNANKRVTKILDDYGMIKICWDVDTLDWKLKNTEKIVKEALGQVKDGSIILMHDTYPASVEAVSVLIDKLRAEGYEIVSLDRLLNGEH